MPTRWLIFAALLCGLAILVSAAVFFVMAANQ
jgi:membrane protein implicated in regulation of membrane protease activity